MLLTCGQIQDFDAPVEEIEESDYSEEYEVPLKSWDVLGWIRGRAIHHTSCAVAVLEGIHQK